MVCHGHADNGSSSAGQQDLPGFGVAGAHRLIARRRSARCSVRSCVMEWHECRVKVLCQSWSLLGAKANSSIPCSRTRSVAATTTSICNEVKSSRLSRRTCPFTNPCIAPIDKLRSSSTSTSTRTPGNPDARVALRTTCHNAEPTPRSRKWRIDEDVRAGATAFCNRNRQEMSVTNDAAVGHGDELLARRLPSGGEDCCGSLASGPGKCPGEQGVEVVVRRYYTNSQRHFLPGPA